MSMPTDDEIRLFATGGHNAQWLASMSMAKRLGIHVSLARLALLRRFECQECNGWGIVNRYVVQEPDGTMGKDGDRCDSCDGKGTVLLEEMADAH